MSWWNSSRAVYGAELRAGALCLVDHGWPVVPGTWWLGDGARGDRTGGDTPPGADPVWAYAGSDWVAGWDSEWDSVPTVPGGVAAASCDPAQVTRWWSEAPYSVLLATGGTLDAVEVPAWMGRRMAATLRSVGLVAPLAATPAGRWWFPVTAGGPEPAEFLTAAGMIRHCVGSWVIAPPSECADGLVHWRVNPSACGWRLPVAELVLSAAAEAARWRAAEGDDWSVAQRPTGVAFGMRS
jgi:Bifunctional DNA primase/polymerase, N-terminal